MEFVYAFGTTAFVAIWIGIVGNVVLSIINLSCIGRDDKFVDWWMRRGAGVRAMIGLWVCLLIGSLVAAMIMVSA